MTLTQVEGYARAHAQLDAEQRYANAQTIRLAVWGKPEDVDKLRPRADGSAGRSQTTDDYYDEEGLAEALAMHGFVEVPRDG